MTKIPRLFELLKARNLKAVDLSAKTGISTSNISDWKSGRSTPGFDALILISKFLNCSVDYLLGNSDNITGGSGEKLNDYEMRLLNAFRSLPKDERLIWLGKFELLAAQTAEREYKKSEA